MHRALSTAASGMKAQQKKLDVTANNIANVSTPGFKKSRAEFSDMLYQTERVAGTATSQQTQAPVGTQIGTGVRTAGTQRMHSQGSLQQTGNPLDLAIEGDGFFSVQGPGDAPVYTRAGNFKLDASGRLVTSEGYFLTSDITVPPDAQSINVGSDGTVSATLPGTLEPLELGQLEIINFSNPSGLQSLGKNLMSATASSGAPIAGNPGENGTGMLTQGMLETSNVEVVEEMIDLIAGQRAYEVSSRVVRAADEMLGQAAQLR